MESVIFPEIRADGCRIQGLLEEYDQEEMVRMHLVSGRLAVSSRGAEPEIS